MGSFEQMKAAVDKYGGGLSPGGKGLSPGDLVDPWQCHHCTGQLGIPHEAVNGKWFQTCQDCNRTQRLSPGHPAIREQQGFDRPRVPVVRASVDPPFAGS